MRLRARRLSWNLAVPLLFLVPFASYGQGQDVSYYVLHPIETATKIVEPSSPEEGDHSLPHLFYAKCWNDSVNAISEDNSVVAFSFNGKPYYSSTSHPTVGGWLQASHLNLQGGKGRACAISDDGYRVGGSIKSQVDSSQPAVWTRYPLAFEIGPSTPGNQEEGVFLTFDGNYWGGIRDGHSAVGRNINGSVSWLEQGPLELAADSAIHALDLSNPGLFPRSWGYSKAWPPPPSPEIDRIKITHGEVGVGSYQISFFGDRPSAFHAGFYGEAGVGCIGVGGEPRAFRNGDFLTSGPDASCAFSLNRSITVVGTVGDDYQNYGNLPKGYMWTKFGGRELNGSRWGTRIFSVPENHQPADYRIVDARAINDKGEIAVNVFYQPDNGFYPGILVPTVIPLKIEAPTTIMQGEMGEIEVTLNRVPPVGRVSEEDPTKFGLRPDWDFDVNLIWLDGSAEFTTDTKIQEFSFTALGPPYAPSPFPVTIALGLNGVVVETTVLVVQPEVCDDGIDNDGNGLGDCADPVCHLETCWPEHICFDEECMFFEEICDDGIDNDYDGLVDCEDPECLGKICNEEQALICQYDESCADTLFEICFDHIDNDYNGYIDCGDPGCLGKRCDASDPSYVCVDLGACEPGPEICDDTIDNDHNGAIDCEDEACYWMPCGPGMVCYWDECLPEEICDDGIDNNGDGRVDCEEVEQCLLKPCGPGMICEGDQCVSEEVCDDEIDNNGNGMVDCEEVDQCYMRRCAPGHICDGDRCVPLPEICWDWIDNNEDGQTDCDDPECLGAICDVYGNICHANGDCAPPPEICDDEIDNDGDGDIDCLDSDCGGEICAPGRRCMGHRCRPVPEICDDGIDNNHNDQVDCDDPWCLGSSCDEMGNVCHADGSCAPPPEICEDGIDNNGDGKVDCEDPDCDTEICSADGGRCVQGACTEVHCGDEIDNDGDDLIDCLDPDCAFRTCGVGKWCVATACVDEF